MPKHKARRVCQPQRFVAVSEADVDASKKPIVVKNTEKATAWAVGVFMSWIEERNEEQCPMEVLCRIVSAAEHFHWTLLLVSLVSLFDPRHEDSDSPRCCFLSVFHHDELASIHVSFRNGYKTLRLADSPRLVLWHVFEVGVTLEIVSGVL